MTLSIPVTFASGGERLDRAAHLRGQVDRLLADRGARLLPLHEGKALIALGDGWPRLGWVAPDARTLAIAREAPVFLGLYEGIPSFAADMSGRIEAELEGNWIAGAKFIDLRSIAGELTAADATVAASAKGVLDWHASHPFCARCGAASHVEEGGWRRRCGTCGGLHFPRIDPVVIMLVVRGERVLLGRQSRFPAGMYSLLAGFMEPGETLEDAVRRETREEADIQVGRVRYLACQPWPFPSSLMFGCHAEALSDAITVDSDELEDAFWLPRAELPDVLAGRHARLAAPRLTAIARVLLSAWSEREVPDFD